jgi:predicted dienelactone hydrolase
MSKQKLNPIPAPCTGLKWLPGLGLLLSLWSAPTQAAEQVNLTFGSTTQSISTRELESFAQGEQPSGQLATMLRFAPAGSTPQVREFLQRRFEFSPSLVTQFASTTAGQSVFRGLGQLMRTQNNENGQQALVTAFERAAANPQGFTILNILRQFPAPSMQIDGQLALSTILQLNQQRRSLSQIQATIQQQAAAAPPAKITNPENLSQPGRLQWQKVTLTFVRPQLTPQPIPVDLYLPQGMQAPAPVIIISHGFASDRSTFAHLAEHLASYGFAVAVPEFVGTSAQRVSGFLNQADAERIDLPKSLIARPLGISMLLDELEKKATTDPALRGKINLQQVGLLGQSLGGYTVLAAGGATLDFAGLKQSCRNLESNQLQALFDLSVLFQCQAKSAPSVRTNFVDPRVKAVIAINPFTSLVFGQQGMGQIKLPVMIVGGTNDLFTPLLQQQITPFSWINAANSNKYLVVLDPGTHFSFLGDGKDPSGALPVPPEIIGPEPALARPALQALSTAFFLSYVANQNQYLPYLSQSYAQTMVQKPFTIDLIQSLTLNR